MGYIRKHWKEVFMSIAQAQASNHTRMRKIQGYARLKLYS